MVKVLPGGGVIFYIRHNFSYVPCSFFYFKYNFRDVWRKSQFRICAFSGVVLHTPCTPPPKALFRPLKENAPDAAFFAIWAYEHEYTVEMLFLRDDYLYCFISSSARSSPKSFAFFKFCKQSCFFFISP